MNKKLLLFIIVITVTVLIMTSSTALSVINQDTVDVRLKELEKTAGMYFTTTGGKASSSSPDCKLENVVKASTGYRANASKYLDHWPAVNISYPSISTKSPRGWVMPTCYSCKAFAGFAGWYIAASGNSETIKFRRVIDCTSDEIHRYAQPGDIVTTTEGSQGHAFIYLSDGQSIDCNYNNKCKVILNQYLKESSLKATISRAMNVASIDPYIAINEYTDESTGHVYRLYNGYGSWEDANNYISDHLGAGWHLVTIQDDPEQKIAADLAKNWNGKQWGGSCWIGAVWNGSEWRWINGEPFTYNSQWRVRAEGSNTLYGCIYGISCNEKASTGYPAIHAVQGKWEGLTALDHATQSGFIAEYDGGGSLLAYSRRVWKSKTDHLTAYEECSTDAPAVGQYSKNELITSVAFYRGNDHEIWIECENGGFIPCSLLSYEYDSTLWEVVPYSIPEGEVHHVSDYKIRAELNSSDSLMGFNAAITDRDESIIVREYNWETEDPACCKLDMASTGLNDALHLYMLPAGRYRLGITPFFRGIDEADGSSYQVTQNTVYWYFSVMKEAVPYIVTYPNGLNVRSQPEKSSAKVAWMEKGTVFHVYLESSVLSGTDGYTWAEVILKDGTKGWAAINVKEYCVPKVISAVVPNNKIIKLPANIKAIEEETLAGNAAWKITVPDSVGRIGSRAFADSDLLYLELPEGRMTFADDMLAGCSPDIVIICKRGSSAEEWAEENGLTTIYK